jgi:V8-like Glu-specific endopeptidase
MTYITKEVFVNRQPIPVPLEGMKTIIYQMENSICKIYGENGKKATGFFCSIPYFDKKLPFLITNNHVLNETEIENGRTIKFTVNNKKKEIIIDGSRIKYTNQELDITFIEIRPDKDEITNFIEIDPDINAEDDVLELECRKKSVYIIHYPKGKLSVSYGLIDHLVDGKKLNHCCNTEEGSSGSPILSLETYKILGIHYGGNDKRNFGTFIKYAIEEVKKAKKLGNKNENEINLIFKIREENKNKMNRIFGDGFIKYNKNNIDLILNGKKQKLVSKCILEKCENKITMILKNELTK